MKSDIEIIAARQHANKGPNVELEEPEEVEFEFPKVAILAKPVLRKKKKRKEDPAIIEGTYGRMSRAAI